MDRAVRLLSVKLSAPDFGDDSWKKTFEKNERHIRSNIVQISWDSTSKEDIFRLIQITDCIDRIGQFFTFLIRNFSGKRCYNKSQMNR